MEAKIVNGRSSHRSWSFMYWLLVIAYLNQYKSLLFWLSCQRLEDPGLVLHIYPNEFHVPSKVNLKLNNQDRIRKWTWECQSIWVVILLITQRWLIKISRTSPYTVGRVRVVRPGFDGFKRNPLNIAATPHPPPPHLCTSRSFVALAALLG